MKRLLILLFSIVCVNTLLAQVGPVPLQEVKAVFLYNFTGFVDWPDTCFTHAEEPLVIGVWGDNPFGGYLDEVVVNEKKGAHPLKVKYFTRIEDIKKCHILFINKPKTDQVVQALATVKGSSVLTVSDSPEFARHGGMIRFYTESSKVKLQVNIDAVKDANLVISSKLLRLAEIISSAKQ